MRFQKMESSGLLLRTASRSAGLSSAAEQPRSVESESITGKDPEVALEKNLMMMRSAGCSLVYTACPLLLAVS